MVRALIAAVTTKFFGSPAFAMDAKDVLLDSAKDNESAAKALVDKFPELRDEGRIPSPIRTSGGGSFSSEEGRVVYRDFASKYPPHERETIAKQMAIDYMNQLHPNPSMPVIPESAVLDLENSHQGLDEKHNSPDVTGTPPRNNGADAKVSGDNLQHLLREDSPIRADDSASHAPEPAVSPRQPAPIVAAEEAGPRPAPDMSQIIREGDAARNAAERLNAGLTNGQWLMGYGNERPGYIGYFMGDHPEVNSGYQTFGDGGPSGPGLRDWITGENLNSDQQCTRLKIIYSTLTVTAIVSAVTVYIYNYEAINNGVYQRTFETPQEAHSRAVKLRALNPKPLHPSVIELQETKALGDQIRALPPGSRLGAELWTPRTVNPDMLNGGGPSTNMHTYMDNVFADAVNIRESCLAPAMGHTSASLNNAIGQIAPNWGLYTVSALGMSYLKGAGFTVIGAAKATAAMVGTSLTTMFSSGINYLGTSAGAMVSGSLSAVGTLMGGATNGTSQTLGSVFDLGVHTLENLGIISSQQAQRIRAWRTVTNSRIQQLFDTVVSNASRFFFGPSSTPEKDGTTAGVTTTQKEPFAWTESLIALVLFFIYKLVKRLIEARLQPRPKEVVTKD